MQLLDPAGAGVKKFDVQCPLFDEQRKTYAQLEVFRFGPKAGMESTRVWFSQLN